MECFLLNALARESAVPSDLLPSLSCHFREQRCQSGPAGRAEAALGDKAGHEACRGHIKGRIAGRRFVRVITSTFLQGQKNFTATLGFLSMNGTYTSDQGIMMAGAVIMIVPVILFFISVQKYFIDGLVSGSVKG